MNRLDLLRLAQKNLRSRKIRTALTTLGVVIGTTSIIVMLSLGLGLKESQRQSMERWGSLTMIRVYQGMIFDQEGNPLGEGKALNDEAVAEIRAIKGVTAVSPAYEAGGEAKFGRKRGGIQLIGIDPSIMGELEFKASQGRLLEDGDRNVMVVGAQVINSFQEESELRRMQRGMDSMMRIGPREKKDPGEMLDQRIAMVTMNAAKPDKKRLFNFQVIGILEGDYNENAYQAYAPIEDIKKMRKFMMGGAQNQRGMSSGMVRVMSSTGGAARVSVGKRTSKFDADDYNYILIRTADVTETSRISQTLKDNGYSCSSIADALEGIEKTSRTIQAVLGGIGSITLLVAALGITNTMIMSIYERTREIGIMKVIGATFRDIHTLFLTEAGLIGFMGGLLGLGFSYLVSYVINNLTKDFMTGGMPVSAEEVVGISFIPPWLALFALLFAVLIGVLAGLYPAYRAVRLSPIRAIRNE